MAYRPVVEIALTHAGCATGALPGAAIVPDAATRARLAGLRMQAKPVGERLLILSEIGEPGRALVALREPVRLRFAIADLPATADAAALAKAPLFTDDRAGTADPQPLRRVAAPDSAGVAIQIKLTPAQHAAALAGTVRRCTAALPVVSARWCFHLVTDFTNPIAEWQVLRAAGARGAAPDFTASGRSELTAADPNDPIGSALRAANPGCRVIRFLSDAAHPASDVPVPGLELRLGANRLLAALPAPSPAVVRIGGGAAFAHTLRVVSTR